ncbi:MAG: hypothetical protein R3338_08350, partial [Thermoanaerobaculia bacterium]|nr:hypothetical protein [Thermoanaerobaculia bacterium]
MKNGLPARAIGKSLSILWIIAIGAVAGFFIALNQPLFDATSRLMPLLTALLVILSCWGWGTLVGFRLARPSRLVDWLQGLGIGIGITGLFVLLTGLAGLLDPLMLAIWFLLGLSIALFHLVRHRPSVRPPRMRSHWDIVAIVVIVLAIVPNLPYVAAPESTTDALEYHLLIPKAYLLDGSISYLPHFVESNYPSLSEYINVVILSFSDERTTKAFHFWITIAVLGMISVLSKRIDPDASDLLAPALYISMPVVVSVAGVAWNDMLFTFFVLLSVERIVSATEDGTDTGKMVEAAVAAALASWTKYTFAMFFLALLLLFAFGIRRWRWKVRPIVVFGAVLGILSSVWWAKNWIMTGNPVYPFLNEIFASPFWTPEADTYFRTTLTRFEIPDWDWTTYFTFPFHLAVAPRVIDTHTGLIPLVLLPLIFAGRTRVESVLRTFIGTWFLVWIFIQTETRSLLAILAVMIVLIGVRLPSLSWPRVWIRRIFAGLVIAALAFNVVIDLVITEHLYDPIEYFIGLESAEEYRMREVESYPAYAFLNDSDATGVLLVGLHNPYHLERPVWFSSCCDPPIAQAFVEGTRSVRGLENRLRRLGITHVVFNLEGHRSDLEHGLYSWTEDEEQIFEQFINERTEPVWQ